MITQEQARAALFNLSEARDMALIFGTGGGKFSQEQLARHFEEAARALGFTLYPMEALPTEPPATRDPDSGRPSLCEPAALSELSHNFGG